MKSLFMLCVFASVVLCVLRLAGVIAWPFWMLVAPMWIPVVAALAITIVCTLAVFIFGYIWDLLKP